MTNTNVAQDLDKATVPQVLARLLLVQQERHLPDPVDVMTRSERGTVDLRFKAQADMEAWLTALGGRPELIRSATRVNGAVHVWAERRWNGWMIDLEAATAPVTVLDSDTVAGLQAVSAQ